MGVLDAAGGALQNFGNSVIGNIEKARLTLYDYRLFDRMVTVGEYETGRSMRTVNTLSGNSAGAMFYDTGAGDSNALAAFQSDTISRLMLQGETTRQRDFIVRFNPSTLSLQGMGGGKYSITNYDEPEDQQGKPAVTYGALDTRVQFNVQLIFDTTGNFEFTKMVASAAAGSITGNNTGETIENSVRMQVEGFIAALRNPRTRMLGFSWGKMHYRGNLNTLNVQYTMFNELGYPVRAIVQFGMVLVDEKVYRQGMNEWKDKVRKTFPSMTGLGTITSNQANVVERYTGSLLNLSL